MNGEIIFTNIPAVLESCTTLKARIAMLDQILNGMEIAILTASTTGHFDTYRLDTGQTKNEIIYRNIGELQKAYEALLNTQKMLMTRIDINNQGRAHRLVTNKIFKGRNGN